MIHRAYRSLNDPVKLLGFTAAQWFTLVLTGALAVGATQLVGLSVKPAITVCSLILTTVAATAYASEPGGIRPLGLLGDTLSMLLAARRYAPGVAPAGGRSRMGLLITGERAAQTEEAPVDRAEEVFAREDQGRKPNIAPDHARKQRSVELFYMDGAALLLGDPGSETRPQDFHKAKSKF